MATLDLIIRADASRAVLLGDTEIADLAALRPHAAGLTPAALAETALWLDGARYSLITDPAAYEAEVRGRLAQEDPALPWQPDVVRICDFGLPDFGAIAPARREGEAVQAHVRDGYTGLPYAMTLCLDAEGPVTYAPLPLMPRAQDAPAQTTRADLEAEAAEDTVLIFR